MTTPQPPKPRFTFVRDGAARYAPDPPAPAPASPPPPPPLNRFAPRAPTPSSQGAPAPGPPPRRLAPAFGGPPSAHQSPAPGGFGVPPRAAAAPAPPDTRGVGRSLAQLSGSIVVGISALSVARERGLIITYGLGSCVGVAIYDPARKLGGICHYMLPDSRQNSRAATDPLMFGDLAVPALFEAFQRQGGDLARAEVYIAGGASVAALNDVFDIGGRNVRVAREAIVAARQRIRGEECGGRASRTLSLDLATGEILITTPGLQPRRLR